MSVDRQATLNLFFRDPGAADCKTRMAAVLDAGWRTRLAADMVAWTVDKAKRYWPGPLVLRVTPDESAPRMAALYGLPALPQRGGDLGQRMEYVLAGSSPTEAQVIIGCDVPHLDSSVLCHAAEAVRRGHSVLGPAADGGFYLISVSAFRPGLFAGIAWGGGRVRRRLLENAARAGVCFIELEPVRDIDRPEDLAAAAESYVPLRRYHREMVGV